MTSRTMRVEIDTQLYAAVIFAVKNESPFSLDGKLYNITGASRIERTDKMRIVMEEIEM